MGRQFAPQSVRFITPQHYHCYRIKERLLTATVMSDAKKNGAPARAAAYSLLLSLHRYSKWVSSLRTTGASTLPGVGREVRLMLALRDEHPSIIGRQIDELAGRHCFLAEAVEGKASIWPVVSREIEFLSRGASQGEAVNRIISTVESYLKAPRTGDSTAVVTDLRILPKVADQRSAPR